MYRYRYIYMYMYIYNIYYNLSRSNEPPPVVPKRKSSPEGERLGGSEHQPSFILFIVSVIFRLSNSITNFIMSRRPLGQISGNPYNFLLRMIID